MKARIKISFITYEAVSSFMELLLLSGETKITGLEIVSRQPYSVKYEVTYEMEMNSVVVVDMESCL